jgi:hypothetical protein
LVVVGEQILNRAVDGQTIVTTYGEGDKAVKVEFIVESGQLKPKQDKIILVGAPLRVSPWGAM